MKKVVIAGSASLEEEIKCWVDIFNNNGYEVIDYPKSIDNTSEYLNIFNDFIINIRNANIFFVANEDKNGVPGYIGYETFAELIYAISEKTINGKNIEIYLLNNPSRELSCCDEIDFWKEQGIIKIYNKEKIYGLN